VSKVDKILQTMEWEYRYALQDLNMSKFPQHKLLFAKEAATHINRNIRYRMKKILKDHCS